MSQEPVNIAGVCAFPNPSGVRDMRFVDCYYNTLFYLPNHSNIIITKPDGTQMKQQCSYTIRPWNCPLCVEIGSGT